MSRENVGRLKPRIATTRDIDGLTTTLTAAFERDPVWSWAFPDPEDLAVCWRFYIRSALRFPNVWIAGDYAAVSIWIPPRESELTEEEEKRLGSLLRDLIGPRAPVVMDLVERFDASHPRERPHYHLTLLGTHPRYRGRGLGMALLSENLASIDRDGLPAYLESTNPANDRRYERLGFRRVGRFTTPDGEHPIASMWRDARAVEAAGPSE
jgi:ribosomal protein S18 acetylase RimI-like enzyme